MRWKYSAAAFFLFAGLCEAAFQSLASSFWFKGMLGWYVARLDSNSFICEIVPPAADIVIYNLCCIDKSLVHILSSLSRCLEENQLILASKFKTFIVAYLALSIQVFLVSHQHNCHPRVRMFKHFFKPSNQILECRPPCDVVDQKCTDRTPVIRPCYAPKWLLPGRIPYLKFYEAVVVNRHRPGAKLDANREIVSWLESLVGKLEQ